ncbi:MAG: DUF983 domain-containing protein [Bacteroidetes bacterium]|nr:DUF983 domain-containing protein [Bacteroidota bacterium]
MESKPSLLGSILHMRCPYCRKGRFYVSHPYDLKRAGDNLEECPVCHRAYSVEYGFYMGAMYVSYALSVAVGLGAYLLTRWLFPSVTMGWQIVIVGGVTLAVAPLMYAYSKIIYGYIFLPYKGPSDPGYRPVRRADAWK